MANTAHGGDKPSNHFQVFIDSDAFIGWLWEYDAHHQAAHTLFESLHKDKVVLATSNLVVSETATVLSYRSGQAKAIEFLDIIGKADIPVIHIDQDLQIEAYSIFKTQTKKGTSVIDCANVAVMRGFNIPTIFSFDKVYPKVFGLKLAEEV